MRAVVEPAPATLRITNGRHDKVEAAVVRIRAFQLIAEQARVAPDMITGMYHIFILFIFFIVYAYCVCCIIGTLQVNGVPTFFLFDSGPT